MISVQRCLPTGKSNRRDVALQVVGHRFTYPRRCLGQALETGVGAQVKRLDHDAIGIVDEQSSLEFGGAMHLDLHLPPEIRRGGDHFVDRLAPRSDDDARFFFDLPGQALQDVLAVFDHSPGRGPVEAPIASLVAHHEHPIGRFEDGPGNSPCSHALILARSTLRDDAWVTDLSMHPNTQRVVDAATALGVTIAPMRFPDGTKTAADAAAAIGVNVGQIVKSLIFGATHADGTDEVVLAYVSGANQLDERKLAHAAGVSKCHRVDADRVREVTGYPIGGVPPFGHATPLRVFIDPDLLAWPEVWAAAGTWNDVFAIEPHRLVEASAGIVTDLKRF